MARVAPSSRSPNFPARYVSIRTGSPGLPLFTARSPYGVRTTGTAQQVEAQRLLALCQAVALFVHQLGLWLNDAERYALCIGAGARHRSAQGQRRLAPNPSRSATTVAHSVSTGAWLMRISSRQIL